MFSPPTFDLDRRAEALIVSAEVGGNSEKAYAPYRRPEWPGGASGVTVGIGWDCGYNDRATILRVWVKSEGKEKLASVARLTGAKAKAALPAVRDIVIPWWMAQEAFRGDTVPRFYQQMTRCWPGVEDLDNVAQGALLSVVFNRGPSLVGDSRVDMRTIAKLVQKKDYRGIAEAIRHMNITMGPAWRRQGIYNGLSARREAEAKLVESCKP